MKKILIVLFIMVSLHGCNISVPYVEIPSTQANPAPNQIHPSDGYPSPEKADINSSAGQIKNPLLPEGELPPTPNFVPDPEIHKGSISGTVYSFTTNMVIPDTMFYLTPAMGPDDNDFPPALIGPLPESGDVVGRTDDKGQFFLSDVLPGNYYFIVEAPMNWAVALEEGNESPPRMIIIEPDQKNQLGILFVSWP